MNAPTTTNLVLTRAVGQSICLLGVRITVVGFEGRRRVRLAIEAPPGVRVLRGELVEMPADAGAPTGLSTKT